jgi:hypothetical protein
MKKILYFIIGLLAIPTFALATPVSWDFTGGVIQPLQSAWNAVVKGSYFTATSTTLTSTFPRYTATYGTTTNATTTNLVIPTSLNLFSGGFVTTANALCIQLTGSAALCDGSDATGGAGGGLATSTPWTNGYLAYVINDGTISSVATGTLTESVSGLQLDQTRALVGGSAILSLTSGYEIPLSASTTNWNSFYDTPSGRITAGTGIDWSGNTLNGVYTAGDALTLTGEDFDFDGGASPAGALGGTWASPTVDDDGHAHTGATLSGIDISADTNLTADGTEIVLTDDALSLGNSLTFTSATATNFGIVSNLNLFGGGNKSTANDLCIQLTGSSDLCDGGDASGGGGGVSDWIKTTDLTAIRPTTTVGIWVGASSTISELNTASLRLNSDTLTDFTGFGMAVDTGALGLLTTGAADGECLVYESTGPTIDWTSCGGVGGSKWTDGTNFTYLTNTTYDLALGSSATSTAPFWWDVSATTSYIGNGGAGDSVLTFGPSGSEWTMGFDDTYDSFVLASSTTLGTYNFFEAYSTTTLTGNSTSTTNIEAGVRFIFNKVPSFWSNSNSTAKMFVNGPMESSYMFLSCYPDTMSTVLSAEAVGSACGNAAYFEDTTGAATTFGTMALGGISVNTLSLADASANGGSGLFFTSGTPQDKFSSTTPRFDGMLNAAGTSTIYAGFTSITPSGTSFEVAPTSFVGFMASSSHANWTATIKTSASASTSVDTGIPSTTAMFFSITTDAGYAYLWAGSATTKNRLIMVGSISSIKDTALVAGIYMARIAAGNGGTTARIGYMEYWKRKPYQYVNY